jgi:hypothetical protein
MVRMGYVDGQEEPTIWVADQPTVGQMFTADKLQLKIRHEYGGEMVDYRGWVGAIVA